MFATKKSFFLMSQQRLVIGLHTEKDPDPRMSHVQAGGAQEHCAVRSNASWIMLTWDRQTDRHRQLKTFPSSNFVVGR